MRINNKQELDEAFAKDMDLFVAVIEPHADSLSLKIARKVPPIRLVKESGLDYYTIAKKNPPSGYKKMSFRTLTHIFGYVFTTKEEAYEYYHALIDTYVEDSIKATYAFREAHTLNS